MLCLETRDEPPEALAAYVAERAGVEPGALTLLYAPTASLAGGVQIAARIVETALHKLHELDFDVRRVVSGFGSCPLPPVAAQRRARRSGARTTRSSTAARSSSPSTRPTTSSRRSSSGCPASASRDYGEPFGKVLEEANWDFYAIDPMLFSPAEVRLVSVASGRQLPRRRREPGGPGAVLPGMIVETVTTTINPDGTVNCAAMGVEWGEEEIVDQAVPRDAHAAQPAGHGRGGGEPHGRHPAVHAGGARGPAAADAAGGARRRRRARRRVLVARGHRRRDRRDRSACPRDDARRRARAPGASSSASAARATPCSRPRSSPRARAGCRRPRSAPSWRASPSWWTRRPARASGRRWTASWRTCAPRSATDDDGPRRGARAAAHGHARRRRRGGAPVRRARGRGEPAGGGGRGERERRARPPRGRTPSGRWPWPSAAAARSADARGAHVRVLEAIPAHVGLGSGTKLALAVDRGAGRAGRTVARPAGAGAQRPGAAHARRWACGPSRSAASWSRAAGAAAPTQPAPLLMRHAMPEEWRCVLAVPAAEPGLSGRAEEEAFARLRPDPERAGADRPARADRAAARRSSSATSASSARR